MEAFLPDVTDRVALLGSFEATGSTLYPPQEFHLPARVISVQQCASLLSYYLRNYPVRESPEWLAEGRLNQDLLPWNIDATRRNADTARRKAVYDALPKCFVRRDWLRLALKELKVTIASKSDDALIQLDYANEVLSIVCDEERFVVSARGLTWPNAIFMRVGDIRNLPKRLRGEEISVVVIDVHLQIGTNYYPRQIIEQSPPAYCVGLPETPG